MIFHRTRWLARLAVVVCTLIASNFIHAKKETLFPLNTFSHDMQLQLFDSLGFPVPNTQFSITIDVMQIGPWVMLQLPLINFQTGPVANNPFEVPFLPALIPGGYLYTTNGFLPENLRPTDLVPRSIVAASNNGLSPIYDQALSTTTFPVPPAGYIVQVTNAGGLVVQSAGTFGNIIQPGAQVLLPTNISYLVKQKEKLCKNMVISNGFTNTTLFTDNAAANSGFRDSHVNDAFNGVVAWTWTDNSMVADKTNGTMNCMVAVGRVNKKGKLKIGTPVQLTDLAPGIMAWDTAVAINRTNSKNIIVSWGQIDNNTTESILYRAVSFDGGLTWPENGPLNVQPSGGFGDARGVASDKFGNIWCNATDNGPLYIPPIFFVSTDGGVTFQYVFTSPPPSPTENYDYPQICFGGDGSGNYGLYFSTWLSNNLNRIPSVGFIPITGLGQFGVPTISHLRGLINLDAQADITAAADGRVWMQGIPTATKAYTYILPITLLYKSPGALDFNYAGAWQTIVLNDVNFMYDKSDMKSQPIRGYIFQSAQSILYDEARQALYAIVSARVPDSSQNMRIYFIISRDNGQSWSDPIDISNSSLANRGFQSMALDEVTGDLIFGWYDGRNDPTQKSVEYFAGIIPALTLTDLVESVTASNPIYTLPSAA